jgi:hypothetical protein
MTWTVFWTDYFRYAKKHNKIKHNPIFIEAPKAEAVRIIQDLYGGDVLDNASYQVKEYFTLEEATAYFRGCRLTDLGFLEESRGDSSFRYYSLSNYLKQPFVCVVPQNNKYEQPDGTQCSQCRDFVLWAEPDLETNTFTCRACRQDPYRCSPVTSEDV